MVEREKGHSDQRDYLTFEEEEEEEEESEKRETKNVANREVEER